MATSSFDKHFVVKSAAALRRLDKVLSNPQPLKVRTIDVNAESKRGAEILKRRWLS